MRHEEPLHSQELDLEDQNVVEKGFLRTNWQFQLLLSILGILMEFQPHWVTVLLLIYIKFNKLLWVIGNFTHFV